MASEDSVYSGWLTKIGQQRTNWKKRWFILDVESRMLSYYGGKMDTSPKGAIALDHHSMVQKSYKFPKRKWCFELGGLKRRTYYMDAGSEKEMTSWIERISAAIRKYQEGAADSVGQPVDAAALKKRPLTQAEELESTPLVPSGGPLAAERHPPGLADKIIPEAVRYSIREFDQSSLNPPAVDERSPAGGVGSPPSAELLPPDDLSLLPPAGPPVFAVASSEAPAVLPESVQLPLTGQLEPPPPGVIIPPPVGILQPPPPAQPALSVAPVVQVVAQQPSDPAALVPDPHPEVGSVGVVDSAAVTNPEVESSVPEESVEVVREAVPAPRPAYLVGFDPSAVKLRQRPGGRGRGGPPSSAPPSRKETTTRVPKTSGQPTGGQPTGGQPTGGQPMGGQPMGGQPMGGQPTAGPPAGAPEDAQQHTPPATLAGPAVTRPSAPSVPGGQAEAEAAVQAGNDMHVATMAVQASFEPDGVPVSSTRGGAGAAAADGGAENTAVDPLLALVSQANAQTSRPEPSDGFAAPGSDPVALLAATTAAIESEYAVTAVPVVDQPRRQKQPGGVLGEAVAAQLKERLQSPGQPEAVASRKPKPVEEEQVATEESEAARGRPIQAKPDDEGSTSVPLHVEVPAQAELLPPVAKPDEKHREKITGDTVGLDAKKIMALERQVEDLKRANKRMSDGMKNLNGKVDALTSQHEQMVRQVHQLQSQLQQLQLQGQSHGARRPTAHERGGRGTVRGRGKVPADGFVAASPGQVRAGASLAKNAEEGSASVPVQSESGAPAKSVPVADDGGPPSKPAPVAGDVGSPPSKPVPVAGGGPPMKPPPVAGGGVPIVKVDLVGGDLLPRDDPL